MRNTLSIGVIVCAGLLVAVEAAPQPPQKSRPATVGGFAVRIATALGYQDSTPEAAALDLRVRGIELGTDFDATLTEGVAAKAMADLGYNVVMPAEPSAPVSETRAGFLAGTIAIAGSPGEAGPAGIGPIVSASGIGQCMQQPNRGLCAQCCSDSLPPGFPQGIGMQVCQRICAFGNHPPSPSSP